VQAFLLPAEGRPGAGAVTRRAASAHRAEDHARVTAPFGVDAPPRASRSFRGPVQPWKPGCRRCLFL